MTELGFTHVELMPVMEHPFSGSWGYQVSGYFAPTSRFGTPDDFRFFVDYLHRRGIGVILDWVPGHFPTDAFALARFDGTALYEHLDPRMGFHPEWGTYVFNFGRTEVRNFLLGSAECWLREFHADGLRVDAVASMLYLDYARREGEWIPNAQGGRENLDAVAFLRMLNEQAYARNLGVMTLAEESTSWPAVSRPTYAGGLGFSFKWDMGWMHDTLNYFSKDPVHRRWHHRDLTFGMLYAWNENFVLPLSHDEVVYGKRSLLSKMPGDRWQKFANLRALYGYMWARPGKKLLFMGGEFGQWNEWNHDESLDWDVLQRQRASRTPGAGGRAQPALSHAAGAVGGRPRSRRLPMDRRRQRRRQHDRLHADCATSKRPAPHLRRQFLAGSSPRISHRRAALRLLSRDSQHRRRGLGRQKCRQRGRRRGRADSVQRPAIFHFDYAAAARRVVVRGAARLRDGARSLQTGREPL